MNQRQWPQWAAFGISLAALAVSWFACRDAHKIGVLSESEGRPRIACIVSPSRWADSLVIEDTRGTAINLRATSVVFLLAHPVRPDSQRQHRLIDVRAVIRGYYGDPLAGIESSSRRVYGCAKILNLNFSGTLIDAVAGGLGQIGLTHEGLQTERVIRVECKDAVGTRYVSYFTARTDRDLLDDSRIEAVPIDEPRWRQLDRARDSLERVGNVVDMDAARQVEYGKLIAAACRAALDR